MEEMPLRMNSGPMNKKQIVSKKLILNQVDFAILNNVTLIHK